MSYQTDLAARWRQEIEQMEASIKLFEAGELRLTINYVDVSDQHVADLHRMIAELEKAIPILEGSSA